jgi:dTDP-4-dehydrorhamnose 3,5-epimerase
MTTKPTQSIFIASPSLSLEDFKSDKPFPHAEVTAAAAHAEDMIDGVTVTPLGFHSDSRGSLCELLTTRDGPIEPIVHVYRVTAEAGSRRAWIYHRLQYDRLAFTNGRFRIVLYDIRPRSPTFTMLNIFILGRDQSGLLRIPPFVIHGVHNMDRESATFINLPTEAWDAAAPDKCRLPEDDPRIPFNFDGWR